MFPEKYELSKNNLTVLNVAPEDAGVFYCISRVKGGWYKRLVLYLIVLGEKYFLILNMLNVHAFIYSWGFVSR